MKTYRARIMALMALLLACALSSPAQSSGPVAAPGLLSFAYQMNSTTFPTPAKVTVTLPATSSSQTLSVTQVVSTPQGWLTVTPDTGHSPLALTVTVNPTSLTPGSYAASFTIDTVPTTHNPAVVAVKFSISNPPSTIVVAPSAVTSNFSPPAAGSTSPTLTFLYTTGTAQAAPASSELDVSSTGGIIPFNVTAGIAGAKPGGGGANVWLRVSGSANQIPAQATSGSAFPGSFSPITVTLDMATVKSLLPGSYGAAITIAADNPLNGSTTVSVNLVVSAGAPSVDSIFPSRVVAGPVIDPVITIYGDNFFSTSVVTLQQGANPPIALPTPLLLSRKVLQATISAAFLAVPVAPTVYPIAWTVLVTNPAPPNNPAQTPASTPFFLDDPTQPTIASVVNAASYLPTSVWTGSGTNPVAPPATPATSVSPREIISIFGQNLGPAIVSTASPAATPPSAVLVYPVIWTNVQVAFLIGTGPTATTTYAPIIMTSSNQINAVVPVEVASVIDTANPTVSVRVINGATSTAAFPLTAVKEDPGAFTFGGLGQGQAAVLNYDHTGAATINSTKNTAARGSSIAIFVSGMGELSDVTVPNGAVTSAIASITLKDATTRVDIGGQPAVVTYAGTSPGSIAGLVQINAIVPPTVRTGPAILITVSIGDATMSRRTQAGVTFAVK